MKLTFPADLARATEFSQTLAREILRRFPEWEPFGVLRRREFPEWDPATGAPKKEAGAIVVDFQIPCPNAAAERGLLLSTENSELTVGFHTFHAHYNERRGGACDVIDGLAFVERILAEEVGIVTLYRGDAAASMTTVDLPYALPLGLGNTAYTSGTLRTWLGTHDRDEVYQ